MDSLPSYVWMAAAAAGLAEHGGLVRGTGPPGPRIDQQPGRLCPKGSGLQSSNFLPFQALLFGQRSPKKEQDWGPKGHPIWNPDLAPDLVPNPVPPSMVSFVTGAQCGPKAAPKWWAQNDPKSGTLFETACGHGMAAKLGQNIHLFVPEIQPILGPKTGSNLTPPAASNTPALPQALHPLM